MRKVLLVLLSFFVFGCVDLHAYSKKSVDNFNSGQKVLDGGDFTNYTFTGPDFSHKQLINANFNGAHFNTKEGVHQYQTERDKMEEAKMQGTYATTPGLAGMSPPPIYSQSYYIIYPTFTGANLTNAQFVGATFQHTNKYIYRQHGPVSLEDTLLKGTNFTKANMGQIHFSGAKLGKASQKNTNFTQAFLEGSDFSSVSGKILQDVNFTSAQLNKVNFSSLTIKPTVLFKSANLSQSQMGKIKAESVDFSYATLTNANLAQSVLTKVNFTHANLTKANLANSTITSTIFNSTNMTGTDLSETQLSGATFSQANLTGTNFTKANFAGAVLKGGNFTNALLTKAVFSKSLLDGAEGVLFALIKVQNSQAIKDILNAGYVITSAEMKNIGSHFSKHAKLYNLAQSIKTLTSAYQEDEKEIQKYMKSGNQQWMTVSKRAATTYSQLKEARKQHAVLLSQVAKNDKSGQGVLTDYINGLGQKLLNLIEKLDHAAAVKIINQVAQITSVQLFKNFNLTEQEQPLTYVSSTINMSPILMAAKMNLPTVMKALVKGLQGALGKPGAATYINSMNQSSTSSSGETPLIMLVINNIHTGDERDAGQVAQALIDGGLNLSALPGFMKNALESAGVKGLK